MPKEIRYDGPGARLRVHGQTIERGGTGTVPNHIAAQLVASTAVNVSIVGEETETETTDDEPTGTVEPEAAGEGQTDNDQEES